MNEKLPSKNAVKSFCWVLTICLEKNAGCHHFLVTCMTLMGVDSNGDITTAVICTLLCYGILEIWKDILF